jgi:GNAT superfamily N-acetyltransferase
MNKYTESDIKRGTEIELEEHKNTFSNLKGISSNEIAKNIAIDHLKENPNSYPNEDIISMNVPLFIRMLELAREDIKSDADLHKVVEKVIISSKKGSYLSMKDYNDFITDINNEEKFVSGGDVDKNDTDIKVGANKFKVSIYLGDHSYDNETGKETPMWFCKVYKMNGNDVDGILTLGDDLDGYDIGNFDSRKKAKDFILEYKDELNIILRNDYGEPVNFFSYLSNPNIHFSKGGDVDKKEISDRIECHNPKCDWSWDIKDGGDDLYICHKCFTDNEKYYEKGGSVDYSFYSGRGRRFGDEKKPEIFFVISNSIVGDLKLGDLFSTSIENEYETKTFLDVFHSYKDSINKLFEYLSSKESEYLLEKPNSDFIIEEMTYDGKSINEDASPLINKKIVFKISAKKVKEYKSKYRFKDGGDTNENFFNEGLIAPNGKPSNLTPEQYKLVRTPEFKDWFGDWENDPKNSSKVIDENGEPLVCYHGSNNPNVNIFDTEKSGSVQYSDWGKGIYFTPSKSTADYYSNEALKKIDSEYNRLYKVFEKTNDYTDLKAFQNRGRELTLNVNTIVYSVFLNIKNPLIEPTSGMNDPFLSETAISKNKDGVFIMNNINFWSYDEILAFESNQIKLADGSNTTFDSNNPDIRFKDGGSIEDLISKGVVELKMFDTKPEHAKEYGLDSINPLYVQSLYVNENQRLKGVGKKVLQHIDDYAIKNGHDVVFGHITQNAKFTKDLTETDSSDIDLIKSFLRKNGYETIESNNDFYKITAKSNSEITFDNGGEIVDDKLVALHNISAGQIISANELGGLVTPSIAILKAGQKFTDFGDITLIPNKELINPKNSSIKVYAGDVYSPTVPRKLFNFDKKKLDKESLKIVNKSYTYDEGKYVYHIILNLLSDYSEFYKDLGRMSYEELVKYYFDKFYLAYIVDQDIKIPIPTKDKANYLWGNFDFILSSEQKNRFKPILEKFKKETNEKSYSDIDKKIKSDVYDLLVEVKDNKLQELKSKRDEEYINDLTERINLRFEEEIGTRYNWYDRYFYKLLDAVNSKKELDEKKLKENIDKYFTKSKKEEYKNWLENFIYQFLGSEYFLQGNKKLDYNLENLVDATTGKLVGAEKNITFGVNQAKSFATKQFKSLDEIKNKSNILITKEEMNKVDELNSEKFFKLRDALNYENSNSWDALDSLGKALADYYKGSSIESALRKNDYKTPNDYQKDLFKKIADEIKDSPVDYFEAKLQRAVKLNEFDYAIVPFDTDKKVLEILKSNGIKIKKYKTEQERVNETNSIVFKDKNLTFKEGGMINENKNTIFVNSEKGKIPVKLEGYWKDDTELVPIKELINFREFNRLERPKYSLDDSKSNIKTLEDVILKEGITEPLIIEYSLEDNAVLLIEGNHRLNVAINLGFDYFPARVILRRREFPNNQQDKAKKVTGVKPDEYGYVRSNLKPSQVGIKGTVKAFEQGGIIEGQLHSECNPDTGCGEKFDVGGVGHIIEAERDEAVIVSKAFEDNNQYEIIGTPSEIASALNVIGDGKNFDSGAIIKTEDGEEIKVSEIKAESKNTDVESIDPNSIIINRRTMYDENKYVAEGTPKQIASQINNLNNNGVKITDGGSIEKA